MALWRFFLVFALAFGSVLPHCGAATPVSRPATHHAGMAHDQELPSKSHFTDACIGCATPLRFAFAVPAEAMATTEDYVVFDNTMTTRPMALDPPPPRKAA